MDDNTDNSTYEIRQECVIKNNRYMYYLTIFKCL